MSEEFIRPTTTAQNHAESDVRTEKKIDVEKGDGPEPALENKSKKCSIWSYSWGRLKHEVASSIWCSHALWALCLVSYVVLAAVQKEPHWVSRAGGVMAFVGLMMTAIATFRVEHGQTKGKSASEDIFYQQGIVVSLFGTLIWAFGDLIVTIRLFFGDLFIQR